MRYTFNAPVKDPAAVLRHEMDWTGWLDEGETITDRDATSSVPAELVIDQIDDAAGVVSWRVGGGTARKSYVVTVEITTSDGRTDQRSINYRVENR